MADHEPARRRGSQIVCCLLSTPISRPRGMIFGGQQVQLQTMLMVQTACLYLVWMWRKSVVKMHPL